MISLRVFWSILKKGCPLLKTKYGVPSLWSPLVEFFFGKLPQKILYINTHWSLCISGHSSLICESCWCANFFVILLISLPLYGICKYSCFDSHEIQSTKYSSWKLKVCALYPKHVNYVGFWVQMQSLFEHLSSSFALVHFVFQKSGVVFFFLGGRGVGGGIGIYKLELLLFVEKLA